MAPYPLHNVTGIMLNCRSLCSKLGEIKLLAYTEKPDFLAFTETWVNKYVPSFCNYMSEWKNRIGGRGGGLCFLVKRGVQYTRLDLTPFPSGVLEFLAISLHLKTGNSLKILNIYNPNLNVSIAEMNHYVRQLGNKFIILGDFNAHSPIFSTKCNRSNPTGNMLEQFLSQSSTCLINPIDFYTHLDVSTGKQSCLDLCFASPNISGDISVQQLEDVGSDHLPIKITVALEPVKNEIKIRQKWKCTKENLIKFSEAVPASSLHSPNDIDTVAKDFSERLLKTAEKHIGRTSGKLLIRKSAIWWDTECCDALRNMRKAKRKLIKYPTQPNIEKYKRLNKEFIKMKKDKKSKSFEKFISDIKHDTPPSEVWKKIKAIKGYNISDSGPLDQHGELIVDPKSKATVIAEHLKLISSSLGRRKILPDFDQVFHSASECNTDEYNQELTLEELISALDEAKDSSPGEDEISYKLLKSLDVNNLRELLAIYNQSFQSGLIPDLWKEGMVIPIPKPGKPKQLATSYRPIALLSCAGKTLERIVKKRLEYIVEKKDLLLTSQCGFRKGQGTPDVLLRLEHNIRDSLSSQEICLVGYIDLKSAFDSIWGKGLIYKLVKSGIKGNLIKWLFNFFNDRKIKVLMDGETSNSVDMKSGTPQGAILSPLLFNLMMIDIPQDEHIQLYIYADDITISCRGTDPKIVQKRLQNYLNKFSLWTDSWGLTINPQKSVLQHFTNKRMQCPVVKLKGQVITYKKDQKLLGLYFDSPQLRFGNHIVELKRDCLKRIDLMKTFSSSTWGASSQILRNFYISYIRSKLDYGSNLYGYAAKTNLKKLDSIQNSALRLMLGGRKSSPILSLQAEAGIPSLSLHRDYLHVKQYIKLKNKPKNFTTTDVLNLNKYRIPSYSCPFNSFSWRAIKAMDIFEMPPVKRVNINSDYQPPWINIDSLIKLDFENKVFNNDTFERYVDLFYKDYTLLFTDGSKIEDTRIYSTASGMFCPSNSLSICWKLRPEHSVIGSELFALWRTLLFVENNHFNNVVVFCDSKSALQLILSSKSSYTDVVSKIRNLLVSLNREKTVKLHWIKAHCGIFGNEVADKTANKGHQNTSSELFDLTQLEIISMFKKKFNAYCTDNWKTATEITGKGLFLRQIRDNVSGPRLIVQSKIRRHEVVIHRLRMGHVGLRDYLHRFGLEDDNECNRCQVPETINHYLFNCAEYTVQRDAMSLKLRQIGVTDMSLKNILGGNDMISSKRPEIFKILISYVIETNKISIL